jgi:hypothetical protein
MIKLLDILNESYNPNIYQVNCKVVIGAGNRPITDIISDIRAIPGVTVVDTIESDYKTTEGRHVIELSLKIDPSPFNPFNSASYDEILSNIKKLPDVRGAQFTTNPIVTEHKLQKLIKEVLQEKEDRCKRIADKRYDKPSAYKSGAIVRCRKGNIWKDLKENEQLGEGKQVGTLYHFTRTGELIGILENNILKASDMWATNKDSRPFNAFTRNKNGWNVGGFPTDVRISIDGDKLSNKYKIQPFNMEFGVDEMEERVYKDIPNIKNYITDITINTKTKGNYEIHKDIINKLYPTINLIKEDESLHTWFKRQGPKGKEGGWVDCNAPDGNGGYKACGRKEGEKRSKYPSCRPTPDKCKSPGKGTKWGKTK